MNSSKNNKVVLVGYSGHAFVVAETLMLAGYELAGYLEKEAAENNIFNLHYFGFEQNNEVLDKIRGLYIFPAIGDNAIREKITNFFISKGFELLTAIHPKASVSTFTTIGNGTLICRGAQINPFAKIGRGVIINTGAIIEHECAIEDYAHIAPGAVLAGNVKVGAQSFVGANSVIKQGVDIGKSVIVGAGSVVLNDIQDNTTFAGNPARKLM